MFEPLSHASLMQAKKVSLLNVWMKLSMCQKYLIHANTMENKSKLFREINFRKILLLHNKVSIFGRRVYCTLETTTKRIFSWITTKSSATYCKQAILKKTSKFTDNSYWWDITLLCTKGKKTKQETKGERVQNIFSLEQYYHLAKRITS